MKSTIVTLALLVASSASAWAYLPRDIRPPKVKVVRQGTRPGELHLDLHRSPAHEVSAEGPVGQPSHGKTYFPTYHSQQLRRLAHQQYYGSFGWESPVGPWSNALYGVPRAGEPVFYP